MKLTVRGNRGNCQQASNQNPFFLASYLFQILIVLKKILPQREEFLPVFLRSFV